RRDGRSGCCLRDICFCCRRAESRRLRGSARAMAISAIQLDGPVRTGEIRFHVDCMIDLDGAGVRESWAKCGEFGVPSFKARDAGCEIGRRVTCLEMGMALRTACVRRSRKLDSPTMLDVAGRAGGSENLILVMNGSIMASEARAVVCLRAEKSGTGDVARLATLCQDGMRGGHWSRAVELVVVREAIADKPEQRRDRQENRKQKTRLAKAVRMFEIIQINALREPFGGPLRSRHDSSFPRSS